MSRPFKLYRLQQIDSQLDAMHIRLKEVEKALNDNRAVVEVEQKLASVSEALQRAKNSLRNAEHDTQQQRIKIEQTEATLYGGKVRNPKELQDLQSESAALKRHLSVLEERQFEAMLSEEELSANYDCVAEEKAQILLDQDHRNRQLGLEREKLINDITRTEHERNAGITNIEPEDLQIYNQLRDKRRGIAVSKVVDRACSACGSTLSAVLLNSAHSPNQLSFCETCGRILYIG